MSVRLWEFTQTSKEPEESSCACLGFVLTFFHHAIKQDVSPPEFVWVCKTTIQQITTLFNFPRFSSIANESIEICHFSWEQRFPLRKLVEVFRKSALSLFNNLWAACVYILLCECSSCCYCGLSDLFRLTRQQWSLESYLKDKRASTVNLIRPRSVSVSAMTN